MQIKVSPNIQNTLTPTKCRPAQLTEPGRVHFPQVFDKDSRVGAVVITGNDKFFCGGADIKVGVASGRSTAVRRYMGGCRVGVQALHSCRARTARFSSACCS
jgi:1,4-dihydroxy-2-naphthoyl-CoA synthase